MYIYYVMLYIANAEGVGKEHEVTNLSMHAASSCIIIHVLLIEI